MALTSQAYIALRKALRDKIKSFSILNESGIELFRIQASDPRVTLVSDENTNPLEYHILITGTDTEITSNVTIKGVKAYDAAMSGNELITNTNSQGYIIQDGTETSIKLIQKININ